ncbi:transferrin receptor-like dimerization domain-containing protein [Flagellimonas halotolerans]|uniref:Transferrin receptor-like dimerization domain-containing protein n=1 Tax=Flagellimonas halotolerans TaxID=3112164 RepID=A0ABU6IMS9_9FLAO|nr:MULTISPECIES: transferrin receptor-like dimerization domain-containing protein [unclassified Allomuricauda]MEC3964546.1 transferrin receptor-like dimerization domain-containing protein [Muricauda sp. SYSU M86414]MEC4264415.1 transferrin receptor-like dimerization domain-containing protein [Muricauda sp. SYSU M84420]
MKNKLLPLLLLLGTISVTAQDKIIGFSEKASDEQLQLEADYEKQLSANNLDQWMKLLAAEPHWVGTEYGEKNVKWMEKQFKSWGYKTKIDTYHVLFPYPKVRVLELTAPTQYTAKLEAVPVEGDPYTAQGDKLLPSYNAFSTDGDVEAELVFVNYGVPSDYEELEKLGIDVKGKIVIAKYYGSWRGIKPKLAAEKGAIGCIIYSDPKDDGYYQGDVYPEGAYKNKTGVQRGSVMDMPLYPGDVLTPGYAATKDAKRLKREEAPTITKIPVLPISYEDAQPLLEALKGPVAPASWKGALPLTYHIGPGPAKVHLKLEFDWQLKPAHNLIATLEGDEFPDEWVIRGNHHDAWVHGASDPISGMVALMEEARVIGELAKSGKKPKRTLVYCAWDAEEPGLIGSTEWVEDHIPELKEKAVAYINTDGNSRGYLGVGGSHSLQAMVSQVAHTVTDPQKGVSVAERRKAANVIRGGDNSFTLSALGSGSDYTPFIQHTGIASLNLGYGGEGSGGEYHTIYDTYTHYTRFKDPGFDYGVALANTAGRISLRLANAEVLPFELTQWHSTIETYLGEVMKTLEDMRAEVEKHNKLVQQDAYQLTMDPKKPVAPAKLQDEVPYLDFSPIQNVVADLKKSIATFSKADVLALSGAKKAQLNQKLMGMEQALLQDKGLPRRDWFKHQIYAPGFYTGYGVKTLPGVREAIEQQEWKEAQEQIGVLATTLKHFDAQIQQLNSLVQ